MMISNNIILNRLFTRRIIQELINNKDNKVYTSCIKRYYQDLDSVKNHELITKFYRYLSRKYRNEYFYKNTLLNKLLLGRHSLNTTIALAELPINKSKADFVLINGKATVYEIKTDLDNFDRLESQLNDYYEVFNYVCVVTSESNYNKIRTMLKHTNVGICILTDRNTLSIRKKPGEYNSKLSHTSMFKVLRKKEYENILKSHYGCLPETRQVNHYKMCLNLFKDIDIDLAYKYLLNEIKKRNIHEKEEFVKVPYELRSLVYFSNFKKRDYLNLKKFLNKTWGE